MINDKEHPRFINELPCCASVSKNCQYVVPSQAAHLRKGTGGGMALKPHIKYTTPLCYQCHALQHSIGEVSFWIDVEKPKELALKLYEMSGDVRNGTELALKFRKEFLKFRKQEMRKQ